MVTTQLHQPRTQNRVTWPWLARGAVFTPRHDIILSDWLTGSWTRAVEDREPIGGRSVLITRERDSEGRLTGIEFVDDTTREWLRSIVFDYDEAGRLGEMQDSTASRCYRLAYLYATDGQLDEETLLVWGGHDDRTIRTAVHAKAADSNNLRYVDVLDGLGRRIEDGRYDPARGVLESRRFRGDGRIAKIEQTEYHDDGRIQRVSRFMFDLGAEPDDERPSCRLVEDYGYHEQNGTLAQRVLVEEVRGDISSEDDDWFKRIEEVITYASGRAELPVRDESRFFELHPERGLCERQRLAIDYEYDDFGRLVSRSVEESDLESGEVRRRVSNYDHLLLEDDELDLGDGDTEAASPTDEEPRDGLDVESERVRSYYRKDGELQRRTVYQGGTNCTRDFVVFE